MNQTATDIASQLLTQKRSIMEKSIVATAVRHNSLFLPYFLPVYGFSVHLVINWIRFPLSRK